MILLIAIISFVLGVAYAIAIMCEYYKCGKKHEMKEPETSIILVGHFVVSGLFTIAYEISRLGT